MLHTRRGCVPGALGWTDNHYPIPNLAASSEACKRVMSKIQIEGVCKTYASKTGRVMALENVDLSIKQNEFVTLVGPSGCGKSTLLKLIGALIRPTRGTLLFDGAPLLRPTHDVGIVFQEAVLLQWRTVLDNVLLPTEILGLDKAASRKRARIPTWAPPRSTMKVN